MVLPSPVSWVLEVLPSSGEGAPEQRSPGTPFPPGWEMQLTGGTQELRGFPGQDQAQTIEKKLLILKVESHSHQQRVQPTGLVIAAQGWNFP